MKRVTTDNPKNNYETMMNYAYAKDRWVHLRYADGEENVDLCDYIHKAALEEKGCNCDILNNFMDCDCICALMYKVATQAAELRERLKYYEDKEEGKTDEWISVKERLPESGKSILGLMANKFPFVAAYRECDETWYMPTQTGCSKCKKVVTHWMPLPTPPKENEDV